MSDYCGVDFDGACDDCEPIAEHRSHVVTARRPHACNECGERIQPGERYHRDSYQADGKRCVDRTCEPCREVRGEFYFTMLGGFLWEHFDAEWDNGANVQSCMNRLTTVRAKERMRQQWLKWKGLASPPSQELG